MTLGYCAFVQKFIESKVDPKFDHTRELYKHKSFSLGLSERWMEVPELFTLKRLLMVLLLPPALAVRLLARKVGLPSSSRIFGICASPLMMLVIKP
jgi:hypothetical protein